MNAIGIDISKGKSMVAVLRPFGEIVVSSYETNLTATELKELARLPKGIDGETRAVLEHTGRYYEPVVNMLHEAGLFVSAVNPLLIKNRAIIPFAKLKPTRLMQLKSQDTVLTNGLNCEIMH